MTGEAALLLVATVLVLWGPLLNKLRQGTLNLCEPAVLTSLVFTLAYPVQVLYTSLQPNHSVASMTRYWDNPGVVEQGLAYSLLGFSAYALAYYRAPRILIQTGSRFTIPAVGSGWAVRVVGVYAIGWAARAYMIATGNFATSHFLWSGYDARSAALFWTVSYLTWFGYILAWTSWLVAPRRGSRLVVLAAITTVEASYHLIISGSKTFLVYLILFPLMCRYLCRRKVPKLAGLASAAGLVLFVFPFVAEFRALQLGRESERIQIGEQAALASEAARNAYESLTRDGLQWAWERFLERWHGFDSLSAILAVVPEKVDFFYGHDVMLLPLALVPRFLIPWKPEARLPEVFSYEIYGGGSSVSPFAIGEGYLNGGTLGVVAILASLGLLQRWLYAGFLQPRRAQPLAIAIYVYLFFIAANLDSWIILGYVGSVQHAAVLIIVYFALFRPAQRRAMAPILNRTAGSGLAPK